MDELVLFIVVNIVAAIGIVPLWLFLKYIPKEDDKKEQVAPDDK